MDEILRYCRLCQDQRRESTVQLNETERGVFLIRTIDLLFNIKIQINDELPKKICIKCESMLHLFYDFQKEVEATNEKLQKVLRDTQSSQTKEALVVVTTQDNQNKIDSERRIAQESTETLSDPEDIKVQIINHVEVEDYETNEICKELETNYQILIVQETDDLEHQEEDQSLNSTTTKPKRTRNKTCTCNICGKKVEGPSKLQRHLRIHQDLPRKVRSREKSQMQEIFSCEVCQKQVVSQNKLRKHMESHLPNRQRCHTCDECGNKYLDAASLRIHITLKHSEVVPSYACGICGSEFTRKNYRDYHERQHNAEKKFVCDFCDFRTVKRHNLKRHIKCFHLR